MFILHAKSLQLCLTLCDPMDCSLPDSFVHGNSPGKDTGVGCCPVPPPGDLPNLGIEPASLMSPALTGGFFTTSATWAELAYLLSKLDLYAFKKPMFSLLFFIWLSLTFVKGKL